MTKDSRCKRWFAVYLSVIFQASGFTSAFFFAATNMQSWQQSVKSGKIACFHKEMASTGWECNLQNFETRFFTFLKIDQVLHSQIGATLQQQKKTDPVLVLIIVEWMNNTLKNIFLYHHYTFFSSNHHFKNYYINTWIIIGMRLIWCVSLSDSFAAHRTSCRVIPLQKHDTAGHCKF